MKFIGCNDLKSQLSRRSFFKAGALGVFGLSGLRNLLEVESKAGIINSQKSVIILWMRGGPSQHETFDPKPNASSDYKGHFNSTKTSVPGIQICEHLPMSAKIMDKWSIIRSLYHNNAGHSAADQICFTGYPAGQMADQNYHPSCGSIISERFDGVSQSIPPYVIIPKDVPGVGASYLGNKYRGFQTMSDPSSRGPFSVPNFELDKQLMGDRLLGRKQLSSQLDSIRRDADSSGQMEASDKFTQKAFDILTSDDARNAFNLDAEPKSIRERYGFFSEYKAPTPDRCGVPAWNQRFLLARRLVEHGVRMVVVDVRWWDTHVRSDETMKDCLLPSFDMAYSALIEDLHQRGMLKDTMVLAWGEFGRTPKVNISGGRDHWPNVFSAAIAGGIIKGGRVVGSSDAQGGSPNESPKTPQDVLATLYSHIGIDTSKQFTDHGGRPHSILTGGEVIKELI